MEPKFHQENQQSREEEVELARSMKKYNNSSGAKAFGQPRKQVTYRDSLVGDIPWAYAQAFKFDRCKDAGAKLDSDLEDLNEGMAEVILSKETKSRIRAPWSKALTVKVFGRTVGYNYLAFKINALWKPAARMDCVDLSKDFFLIKFSDNDDYDKVLQGGP